MTGCRPNPLVLITGKWKCVSNGFDDDELYDLAADPHEMTNPAARPEARERMRALVGRMWRFALREGDHLDNPYGTVALASWGPLDALRPDGCTAMPEGWMT